LKNLIILATLILSACQTTSSNKLSENSFNEAPAIKACSDVAKFPNKERAKSLKNKGIDCSEVLLQAMRDETRLLNNADLCNDHMGVHDPILRDVVNKEVKRRDIQCADIIIANNMSKGQRYKFGFGASQAFTTILSYAQMYEAINTLGDDNVTNCIVTATGYRCSN
jgi:hypothetical protein